MACATDYTIANILRGYTEKVIIPGEVKNGDVVSLWNESTNVAIQCRARWCWFNGVDTLAELSLNNQQQADT